MVGFPSAELTGAVRSPLLEPTTMTRQNKANLTVRDTDSVIFTFKPVCRFLYVLDERLISGALFSKRLSEFLLGDDAFFDE